MKKENINNHYTKEDLVNFEKYGQLDELVPKYYRPEHIIRINQDFVYAENPNIYYEIVNIFRRWLFSYYIKPTGDFFEFGCGPGHNLPVIAELYPSIMIHGLDWAESSVKIIEKMRAQFQIPVKGHLFNVFEPNYQLKVPDNSTFFTSGCLEQIGNRHQAFIEFILSKRPELCVNTEPINEVYDPKSLLDYLALKYTQKRNYLNGYLSSLEDLQKLGKVEIIEKRRVNFGDLYQEGFTIIAWKPV